MSIRISHWSGFDEVNLPTYEGFYTQDIEIPQQINFTREVYNDKIYQVGVLKKTILFPQQNGKITVEPFNMSLLVQQRVKPRSFFDDFFSGYRTVKTTVTSRSGFGKCKRFTTRAGQFLWWRRQF